MLMLLHEGAINYEIMDWGSIPELEKNEWFYNCKIV